MMADQRPKSQMSLDNLSAPQRPAGSNDLERAPESREVRPAGMGDRVLKSWNRYGLHLVVVAAVALVANFLLFTTFGFYEDDWLFFAPPYGVPAEQWFRGMWWAISTFQVGRPLQLFYMLFFGHLGAMANSISLLYAVAAVLYASSALLMYKVMRLRFPGFFALLAALLFALSPLTSLRQFLNGTLAFEPGFICLFVAFLLYSRRKYLGSYAIAVAALLTYETLFLPFIVAPFFKRGRTKPREIARHSCLWGAILIGYLLSRIYTTETRIRSAVTTASHSTLWDAIHFDIYYTVNSFRSYLYAVYLAYHEPTWQGLCWTLGLLIPALFVLFRSQARITGSSSYGHLARIRRLWWLRNAVLPGALALTAGYLLSYWHLGQVLFYPLSGRDTRVSLAASFGSSVFLAAILCFGLTVFPSRWARRIINSAICALLLSVFLYSFVIQKDYAKEWQHQRSVLAQLIMLTPDVTNDTLLVVQESWHDTSLFPSKNRAPSINSQLHGLEASTAVLFGKGGGPRAFFVYSDDWSHYIKARGGRDLYWTQERFNGGWGRDTGVSFGRRVITLVERADGTLYRTNTPIFVDGRQINQIGISKNEQRLQSGWTGFEQSRLVAQAVPRFALTLAVKDVETPPQIDSLYPAMGNGKSQRFAATVSDRAGPDGIGGLYLMFQTSIEPVRSCWLYFDAPAKTLKLAQDDGVNWTNAIAVGGGTLSNSQCTVSGKGASLKAEGQELEFTVPIAFSKGFKGRKKILVYVRNRDNLNSNWQEKGSWLVP